MRILVVVPAQAPRRILCARIEHLHFTPLSAIDGTEALQMFVRERPDIVFLSLDLPDIDGLEVTRRLRAHEEPGEWTPIVHLLHPRQEAVLPSAASAGGDDFLLAPISELVFAAKIVGIQKILLMRRSLLAMTRKLDNSNQELKHLSAVDALTGIANRRQFDQILAREWRRSMRQGSEISLLMCDVDHFKKYNDHYGHQAGDECLAAVADIMVLASGRGGDSAARYGGEEFALILPETSLTGAQRIGQRILDRIAQEAMPHAESQLGRVTVSIGAASAVAMPETDARALIRAADAALYAAKAAGRNRVCVATPEGTR